MTVPALRKSVPKAMLRGFAWSGTTTSNKYSLKAGTVESGAKAGTPTQTFVWDITTFLADLKRGLCQGSSLKKCFDCKSQVDLLRGGHLSMPDGCHRSVTRDRKNQ